MFVSVFMCVCVWGGVFTCLFMTLYICHGSNKAAGKTQIKPKQRNETETEQRGKMRERERARERERESVSI